MIKLIQPSGSLCINSDIVNNNKTTCDGNASHDKITDLIIYLKRLNFDRFTWFHCFSSPEK